MGAQGRALSLVVSLGCGERRDSFKMSPLCPAEALDKVRGAPWGDFATLVCARHLGVVEAGSCHDQEQTLWVCVSVLLLASCTTCTNHKPGMEPGPRALGVWSLRR